MRTRRTAALVAIVLASFFATGCTSATTAASGKSSAVPSGAVSTGTASPPTTTPTTTPTATATPAAPSVAVLTTEVTHTKLAKVTGSHFEAVDRSGSPPLDVCSGKIAAYAQVSYETTWQWLGAGTPTFKEGVFAFQTITGDTVVAQARALAGSCKSHVVSDGTITTRIATSAVLSVPAPSGVDAFFAFCETHTVLKPALLAGTAAYCTAVMSRGHIAVFLNAGGLFASQARKLIEQYLKPTASALVAAVPTTA